MQHAMSVGLAGWHRRALADGWSINGNRRRAATVLCYAIGKLQLAQLLRHLQRVDAVLLARDDCASFRIGKPRSRKLLVDLIIADLSRGCADHRAPYEISCPALWFGFDGRRGGFARCFCSSLAL